MGGHRLRRLLRSACPQRAWTRCFRLTIWHVAGAAPRSIPCHLFRLPCTAVCHPHRKQSSAWGNLLISQRQLPPTNQRPTLLISRRDLLCIRPIVQFPAENAPAKFFVVHCQNAVNRALFQLGQQIEDRQIDIPQHRQFGEQIVDLEALRFRQRLGQPLAHLLFVQGDVF